jgi:Cupin-like domain
MSKVAVTGPKYIDIPIVRGLSRADFERTYAILEQPVILEDFEDVARWEVLHRWSMQSFAEEFGHLQIDPRVNYPNPDHWWINPFEIKPKDFPPYKRMTVADFIERACDPATKSSPVYWRNRGAHNAAVAETDMRFFIDGIHFERLIASCADSHLDILIGSSGTRAGFHHDDRHNFIMMIDGEKQVYLGSPYYTRCFHPFPGIPEKSPIAPDHANPKYPLFSRAVIVRGQIHKGQILFIPRGWWHSLLSTTPTIMLACFFGETIKQCDSEYMYSSLGPGHKVAEAFEFVRRYMRSSWNIITGRPPTDGLTVWWTPGTAAAVKSFNRIAALFETARARIVGRNPSTREWISNPFF